MDDQFDVGLEDGELLGEIELLTQLMIAVVPFKHHLSIAQVDFALGLDPSPSPREATHSATGAVDGPRARSSGVLGDQRGTDDHSRLV